MDMFQLAYKIVNKAFAGKKDIAGKPYIDHLRRVSDACGSEGTSVDAELRTVGLLHDILEDCPEWNETVLRTLFPDNVVDVVVILTRTPDESYHEYITKILGYYWATCVKKYDLIDNMDLTRLTEITDKDIERLKKYHKAYLRIIGQ